MNTYFACIFMCILFCCQHFELFYVSFKFMIMNFIDICDISTENLLLIYFPVFPYWDDELCLRPHKWSETLNGLRHRTSCHSRLTFHLTGGRRGRATKQIFSEMYQGLNMSSILWNILGPNLGSGKFRAFVWYFIAWEFSEYLFMGLFPSVLRCYDLPWLW